MADTGPDDWMVPPGASIPAPASASTPASRQQAMDAGPDDWVTLAEVNPTPVSALADVAKAVPSGLAVGAAATAGTPGGILDGIGNAAEYGMQRLAKWSGLAPDTAQPQSYADIAASNRALTRGTDVLPRTEDILQTAHDDAGFTPYQPKTLAGQFAGKTAEFLPSALIGPGSLAAKGTMAAGSAAGDMTAGALTDGTWAEPYARAAGSLVGGAGSALTIHGAKSIAPAFSEAAAKARAAGIILDSAHDPDALRAANAAPAQPDLVPGSKPTSFQQFGDVGLGDVERATQTRNPQAFVENPYGTGTQQQNAARVGALQGVQTGGDAMSVPDLFLRQKQALENAHDAMSGIATQDAKGQASALGGDGTPAQTGQAIKDLVDPQVAAARQGIADRVDAIGGQGQPSDYGAQIKGDLDPMYRATQADAAGQAAALGGADRVDSYGAGLRGQAADAMAQANAKLGDLWDALPGDSAMTLKPVQDFSAGLYGKLGPAARAGVTPAETAIADALRQYGPTVPFSEARQVDSLITSSMRQELKDKGRTPAYARMVQMKGAYEDALHSSLSDQAASDAAAVAAGAMDPSQTAGARIQAASGSGGVPGAPSVAFTPAGTRVGTDYGVVDLGDLTASHSADGVPNPAFPQELQPRDRSRAASQAQIADMASGLQPERLGHSTSTTDGAPVIGPDGVVESGNGRILALGRAYDQGGPQATAYRTFLEGHGYDLAGMDRPVLVRQRTSEMTPEERIAFTRESNAPTVLAASAPERAATDAGAVSDGLLASYQGGDVASAANRPFVRGFIEAATSPNERGALVAGDGTLSREGASRVNNALLHAGYGDSRLVSSLAETGDPDIAAFGRSLQDNAGRMAQLRRGIAAGEIHEGADLSGHAVEAARVVQRARSTGQSVAGIVDQADAFSPISREAHSLLQAGYGEDMSGRFSRARLNAVLSDALDEAHQQQAGARLFGEPLGAQDILDGARTRYASRHTGTPDPLADGAGDLGTGAGAPRQTGSGPGPRAGRPEGTGGRQGRGVLPDVAPSGPPLDQAALDAQDVARQATKDFHATFRKGVGGDILRSDGTSGSYRLPDAGVGAKVFPSGKGGYQAVQAYRRMVGDSADAASLLHNYAAATLRKVALRDDGTLNPAGYAKWRSQYDEAFHALPEDIRRQFDTAGHAAEALDRFRRFTPETAASLVPDQFFRPGVTGADGVEHLRSLVGDDRANAVLGDYAASSLRRAAARPDGTIDPGRYATWRRNHDGALGALPDDVRARFDTAAKAGDALKRFGRYSSDMAPSTVPEMFFAPGKAGRDGVEHLRSLVGDQNADAILSDHAAGLLKAKASNPDGTLDPRGLDRFMAAHGPAMSAFPRLADRFSSAARASQTVADIAAGRAAALKDFQATAAGKFMGYTDPTEVRDAVGRMIASNNVTGLRKLMKQVAAEPDAVAGVKRAAADYMLRDSLSSSAEAGASGVKELNKGTFQNRLNDSRAALGEVFDQRQMGTLNAISADVMRAQRTVNAVKIKGSPNTAADLLRVARMTPPGHESTMRQMIEGAIGGGEAGHALAGEAGGEHGALLGMAATLGRSMIHKMTDAGMRKVSDVLEHAMLDPEFFRTLVQNAPKTAGTGSHLTLANRLGRASMYRAAQAETASQDDRKSSR